MSHTYEYAIIGAGPAGLAFGRKLVDSGCTDFIVIDKGRDLKDKSRYDPLDSVTGVGACGLFSDGKLSFFPSSTALWDLFDANHLDEALNYVLRLAGFDKNKIKSSNKKNTEKINEWNLKEYPSLYVDLDERIRMIEELRKGFKEIKFECTVEEITKTSDYYKLTLSNGETIQTKKIIIAGGRLHSIDHFKILPYVFKRIEYGVRIVADPNNSYFVKNKLLDPKYKLSKNNGTIEYRTFCCCRKGETICTEYPTKTKGLIRSYSGRSDCDPTNESNTGFNVRITDEKLANKIQIGSEIFSDIELQKVLSGEINLDKYFGKTGAELLVQGLESFVNKFPDLKCATLKGPTIEGVGEYIQTNDDSKVPNESIWVIGDASGKYRGLTAALLSGYCLATQIH